MTFPGVEIRKIIHFVLFAWPWKSQSGMCFCFIWIKTSFKVWF